MTNSKSPIDGIPVKPIIAIGIILILALLGKSMYKVIPVGFVGVTTLFGDVRKTHYPAGLQFPVNPLLKWILFDIRQKSHLEKADVPTQDLLQTQMEISIQYRLIPTHAPNILEDTGSMEDMLRIHLVPKLRSVMREQGKSIMQAQDFFLEETQNTLQINMKAALTEFIEPMGMNIQAVLIRDITLPPKIAKAIEDKKEAEQATEKEKATLERVKIENDQVAVRAEAQLKAADAEAKQIRLLADARAYEIKALNTAIGTNGNYIKLQSIEALKSISKDPAAKIYFLNGDSPNPLPLLHMGDKQ